MLRGWRHISYIFCFVLWNLGVIALDVISHDSCDSHNNAKLRILELSVLTSIMKFQYFMLTWHEMEPSLILIQSYWSIVFHFSTWHRVYKGTCASQTYYITNQRTFCVASTVIDRAEFLWISLLLLRFNINSYTHFLATNLNINKMASVSQCRQNYDERSEAAINKQINMELTASYTYQAMVSFFYYITRFSTHF